MKKLVDRAGWRVAAIVVTAIAFLLGGGPPPLRAAGPHETGYPAGAIVPGEVLVKFRYDLDPTVGRLAVGALAATPRRTIDPLQVHRFAVPVGEERRYVDQFGHNPFVEFAEPNYRVSAAVLPDDPGLTGGSQWHIAKIDAPTAWDITTGGEHTVTVALLDTGIDSRHPDLINKVITGYDVFAKSAITVGTNTDFFSHGTHVAGIMAAHTNNALGIGGVSWKAQIMPIKMLDSTGFGTVADLAEGAIWAVDNGARVLNMSLGGDASESEIRTAQAAIDYARRRGAVSVAAAGNGGSNRIDYPAALDHVISVASTDTTDTRSSFSNYNEFVDVAAPGRGIYSTLPNGGYGNKNGTSMSTPIVSGLAALLISLDPSLTPDQVTQQILSGTVDLSPAGKDIYTGWGRVSAPRTILQSAIDVERERVDLVNAAGASASVVISGNGAGTVNWRAISDVPWLKVTGGVTTTGKISAQGTGQLVITPDPALVPAGTVSGTVRVGALLGDELIAPQTIHVNLIHSRVLLPAVRRAAQE